VTEEHRCEKLAESFCAVSPAETQTHDLLVYPKAVAYSLRRLAYNHYGWLAGLSRGLGLLVAYGG